MELVDQVMSIEPYASARAACSGSSTTAQSTTGNARSTGWPRRGRRALVHLPVHASWLNQIEIVFSVIQRKVISPADFADLAELADRLAASSSATTRPPSRSTGGSPQDLSVLLERLDAHRPQPAALAA